MVYRAATCSATCAAACVVSLQRPCVHQAHHLLQDHVAGKQYQGWKAIRDKLVVLREKYANKAAEDGEIPEVGGHAEDGGPRPRSRHSRERSRSRERSSRSRERSRERDRYRSRGRYVCGWGGGFGII